MSSLGNNVLIREGVVYGEEEIGAQWKGELVVWLTRIVSSIEPDMLIQ